MVKILTDEELNNYIEKLKDLKKEELLQKHINAARAVNELRKKIREKEERENALSEKELELNNREQSIVKKEEQNNKLFEKNSQNKAEIEAKELEISITEKTLKEAQKTIEEMLKKVSEEKIKLVTEYEKKSKETYALRSEEIEKEIKNKRTSAQTEYDSIIKQANEVSDKIKTSAQTEYDSIIKQANEVSNKIKASAQTEYDSIIKQANAIKTDAQQKCDNIQDCISKKEKLEIENTELNTKVGTIDSLIKEKAKVEAENAKLKSELETTKQTNEILMERTRKFEEYETLDKTLQSAELSINSVIESIKNLEINKQKLQQEQEELKKNQDSLVIYKKRIDNKEAVLDEREKNINEEVTKKVANENVVREQELVTLRKQLEELKTVCAQKDDVVTLMENIKQRLGEDPASALAKIANYDANMKQLEEEIAKLPSYMMRKKMEDLKQQEGLLEQKEAELDKKIKEKEQDIKENAKLKVKNSELEKECREYKEQLDRLLGTYDNTENIDDRIKQINTVCEGFKNPKERLSDDKCPKSEQEWLSKVKDKIKESGFNFPPRIINAFHTALKTADISPLTVLAGVSGTGKSKLPELYTRFGGINFLSVPVQPNWDCQESMTGFYNSIDNCFEPTRILKFLVQSQRDPNNENGLNDVMNMILLDEMNLANIELYFADFLSTLETRRGHKDDDIPPIWIKLGSKGMKKYHLTLGRNVLWVGTMNQDETTKTLSDKVLDRGIVINFPSPDKFEPLPKTKLIKEEPLLPKHIWESWVNNIYDFSKNETLNKLLKENKEKIEKINEELGKAGRAIGHRVWQSIEKYISLYPGVSKDNDNSTIKAAMENAFEDQIVQKIMPKLRGLETRGSQGEVLNNIKGYIPETLHDDYKNAQEQGYGQFMWTSSGYILEKSKVSDEVPTTIEEKSNDSVVVAVAEEKHITEKPKKNNNDNDDNDNDNNNNDSDSDSVIEKVCKVIKSGKIKKEYQAIVKYIMNLGFNENKANNMAVKITKKLKNNN